ncbi:MAG: AI-2E family transporter [Bdellovibrionota bacterium]|jgi:predicted PurR-regulated permease PerM
MVSTSKRLEQIALIVMAAALFIGTFLVLKPFLAAILWALILALVTWPVFVWLCDHLGNRKQLAAIILISCYLILMVVPIVIAGWSLADNVKSAYSATMEILDKGLPPPPTWLEETPLVGAWLDAQWQELAGSRPYLLSILKQVAIYGRDFLLAGTSYAGEAIFYVLLSIFLTFFMYRDGELFFTRLQSAVSKIAGEKSRQLLFVAGSTLRSVVYGIIGTALAQGLLAGIGFWIFGVPNAALLGLLVCIFSPIPVGPPLVWGSVAVWLFYHSQIWSGVFMILWGLLIVSSVDNFLKPYIISKGSKMSLILVLLGVMGGALSFGVLGVFLGPALLAVASTVFVEWSEPKQDSPQQPPQD